jgi:methylaspartate ammonia-lyase
MNHISRVLVVPVVGGYYHEDLTALQDHPLPLEDRYTAAPVTAGFRAVRQVAEGVSVGLVLDSGQVGWGDCVAVAYGGIAGREPVFAPGDGIATIQEMVAPLLQGRPLTSFRELAAEVDALVETVERIRPLPRPQPDSDEPILSQGMSRRQFLTAPARLIRSVQKEIEAEEGPKTERVWVGGPLHTAVRYGTSQALLGACALARNLTMAEVIAEEWDLPLPDAPVPIHAQSGGERYHNADKMIVRRVASLPHALVDDIPAQLGEDGSEMTRYVRWLVKRIQQLGEDGYRPTIHLDMHGALGKICDHQAGRILAQLYALEYVAQPYPLRIESPVIMESRAAQIEMMKKLRKYIGFRKMKMQLVADEWANTLEDIQAFVEEGAADMIQVKMPDLGGVQNSVDAVLACRAAGVGAFLGGSCAETDLSARVSAHVALAARPDILMAKPGMGVDEGVSLVHNEMARTLALIQMRTR